jgi:DNA polymerase-3 subunit gamma/tau
MATYQSLYRRYRPQRFDEVLGQDHVTKALRNAVRDGRVGHAYLFSGPRGTGKTSTARILAKVLNCDAPVDGEPCGKCESCIAVADGRVTDWLLEQDAASKSKVDDMRDLLERVPLGTSGNRKVIILDEVHMLSQGAENALLKTLEEPPSHVVFVLATTDPQKVRPTIRSRTQHFEFRLLPAEVLSDHVRHVIDDAGLGLAAGDVDHAVDHVIRSGGGSARDTLSALDQVAALGEVVDEAQPVDAVLDALCERDAGKVLVAVADAVASGRDPRTLGENVISALRDAFLSVMGAADVHLAPAERDRAARVGERLGAPGLTRALDVLGEALTELSRKPDPRIVVEVALVRLTQPAADRTLDAVLERLDRLERGIASGGTPPAPAGTGSTGPGGPAGSPGAARAPGSAGPDPVGRGTGSPGVTAPGTTGAAGGSTSEPSRAAGGVSARAGAASPAPISDAADGRGAAAARDALSTARSVRQPADPGPGAGPFRDGAGPGKPTLGSVARGRRTAAKATSPDEGPAAPSGDATPAPSPEAAAAPSAPVPASQPPAAVAPDGTAPGLPSPAEVDAAWSSAVLASLPVRIRSKWRAGRWAEPGDGALRFAVPNAWHQKACDEYRREVEQALAGHFGRPLTVALVVDDDGSAATAGAPGGPARAAAPSPVGAPAPVDPGPDDADEHIDPSELRDADDVATNGVDLLLREFGGGEVVEEES